MKRSRFAIGDRVKISEGSGPLSGKFATVISWRDIPVRSDGIPNLPGYYRKPDRTKETPIRIGKTVALMFSSRLNHVKGK